MENDRTTTEQSYECNAYHSFGTVSAFGSDLLAKFGDDICPVWDDPITNNESARRISRYIYAKNGVVSNSIDYMTALLTLDGVVISKNDSINGDTKKAKENKTLMKKVLKTINIKQAIRDALFTEMVDGCCFYYLETSKPIQMKEDSLPSYVVENIVEANAYDFNATLITLPVDYTKIIGRKNNRYVLAFNLEYFLNSTIILERELKTFPKEIREAYYKWQKGAGNQWATLDNNHTIVGKIKSKASEVYGRPLAIAALDDILYKDYFVTTKRNILNEVNNKIVYQTFPEGKEKGTSVLSQKQQENQHNAVKEAVMRKNTLGGTSFFSVAAGTKINALDVNTDIFDDKYENGLDDGISLDIGIAATLIGASSKGNYASAQQNLEMITAQLYQWVSELEDEYNAVLNACIIKDSINPAVLKIFPTSFANRDTFFDQMKVLYGYGGSLSYLIAAAGIDPDVYLTALKSEYDEGVYDMVQPHPTNYTYSAKAEKIDETKSVSTAKLTNENTIQSVSNNSNDRPKPSTS